LIDDELRRVRRHGEGDEDRQQGGAHREVSCF
jgi:hypothetical protein